MSPVTVPPIREGQDARLVAANGYGALATANGRLKASRRWYERVQLCFEKPADPVCEPKE